MIFGCNCNLFASKIKHIYTFILMLKTLDITFAQQTLDPLSSLTAEEILTTSKLIKDSQIGASESDLIFVTISRLEPPKALLAPFLQAKRFGMNDSIDSIPRKSIAILIVRNSYKPYSIIVDLKVKKVESIKYLGRGIQPMINPADARAVKSIILNNQTILNRLKGLGLDLERISIATSASSFSEDWRNSDRRILQAFFSFSMFKNDNPFAHPLDFVAFVDVASKEIIRIEDIPTYAGNSGGHPLDNSTLPLESSNYSPLVLPKSFYRERLSPFVTTSYGKPGFTVDLNTSTVSWDKFRFQYSFDPKEALALHDISYDKRSLLYRASHGDMIVPYMDPRSPFQYKHPIDEGEYGLGLLANALIPNSECNPDGKLIDMYVNKADGTARRINGAICVHEEDGGLLHKHTAPNTGTTASKSRILNIFFVATVGNYDYGFYWKFHQDGTIAMEVGMTGLVATSLALDGLTPYGSLVLPKVNAPYHQHIFNVRLDTSFDGETNSVTMQDIVPVPDELNTFGQGIQAQTTPLTTSLNSVTDTNSPTDRIWKISNPNSINPLTKKPVSWKLVPLNKPLLMAKPRSRIYKRGEFGTHSVWVTTYKDGEFYPAGDFPNQSSGGTGLPEYVARNDSIVGTDIVLWHSFGATHIPRAEDFPIMPFEKVGFVLKPVNFFTSYPGLDVPPVE